MIFAAASAHPDVAAALRDCRRAFWSVALFSGLVNLLMLAGPLQQGCCRFPPERGCRAAVNDSKPPCETPVAKSMR
jgi:hypothetical protein